MPPKLSITTPSFNQAPYLEQTIRSVIAQQNVSVEYFVLDGGSTDGSVEIIKKYADRIKYWVSEPDKGQTDAIVRGWKRATGDVLVWLNSDDYFMPNALQKVAEAFSDPSVMVVIGSGAIVDESGNVIGDKYARHFNVETMLTTGGGVPHQPSTFVHRRVIDMIGYPDPELHYVMDWEYWIRIALAIPQNQIRVIYEPFAALRTWEGTKTLTGTEKICDEHRAVLEKLFNGNTLPPHLQKLQARSRAGTYIKQAFLQWQAGRAADARRSLDQAKEIDPSSLSGWHELKLQLQTHLPYPIYEKARHTWGQLRPLLSNIQSPICNL
ncbi:MAG: glycosyltransferase [Chloroflexi bacterium]|nr:glycosyltransferase [Chloroflexota bacterium]